MTILLLGLLLAASPGAHAQFAGSVLSRVPLQSIGDLGRARAVKYGFSIVAPSSLAATDPARAWLARSGGGIGSGDVYLGRARYAVARGQTRFDAAFFQDFAVLRYLMGGSYSLTLRSRVPLEYRASRAAPVALISSIDSTVSLVAYDGARIGDPTVRAAAATLGAGPSSLGSAVLQRLSGFNRYLERAFVFTLVQSVGGGDVEFDVYTGTIADPADSPAPAAIRNLVIESIARQDLTGYAERLSAYP